MVLLTLTAMTGTYLFLDADIESTIEYIKECATRARSGLLNATKIREHVAGAIANYQPPNAGKTTLHRDRRINPVHCSHAAFACV